jgi:hypothetical protein
MPQENDLALATEAFAKAKHIIAKQDAAVVRQGLLDKSNTASGVGRHRLRSAANETFLSPNAWSATIHPSQEAERPRYARDDAAGQQCEIENPRARRGRVCRAKASNEVTRQNYREPPSDDHDRNGQSRLQHQSLKGMRNPLSAELHLAAPWL